MYGEDDYRLGMEVGFPAQHTVGMDGAFVEGVHELLDGRYVKECDDEIINLLQSQGLLYRSTITPMTIHTAGGPTIPCCTTLWTVGSSG